VNPYPLAGLVFHYNRCQGSGVCEAAYLCTDVPTTVLVSPSNYGRLKRAYEAMTERQGANITSWWSRKVCTLNRTKNGTCVNRVVLVLWKERAMYRGASRALNPERASAKVKM
jgi:hypothetical protein